MALSCLEKVSETLAQSRHEILQSRWRFELQMPRPLSLGIGTDVRFADLVKQHLALTRIRLGQVKGGYGANVAAGHRPK